ncbi:MAG TPA: aminoacyl-tRNA hydrolase [candidate division Zixibacteria bacterium]|nr:aminoacyl-tRNA hydrolase [candidate division Zixibacteria bacterium]
MISLIVGLGNIGKRYISTRHNLGFEVVDLAIKTTKAKPLPSEFFYKSFGTTIENEKIDFAKPTTMMNGSGGAVIALLEKLELSPSEMLVVVDDFNIPLGSIRLRANGSDGGHNGLESIIMALGTEDFPRLRLGIGPVPDGEEVVDFVLGKFSKSEEKIAKKMIEMAAEAVIFAAGHRFEETMSKYNYNPV